MKNNTLKYLHWYIKPNNKKKVFFKVNLNLQLFFISWYFWYTLEIINSRISMSFKLKYFNRNWIYKNIVYSLSLPEGSAITVTWSLTLNFPFPIDVLHLFPSALTHGILPLNFLKCRNAAFFPSLLLSLRHFFSDG